MAEKPKKGGSSKRCPICGGPEAETYRPFCSRRCADADLEHWLGGNYRLPSEDEMPDDETSPANDP